MICSPKTWLRWALFIMPGRRSDWLSAMKVELLEITDPQERIEFAFGCFKTALFEWAHSRRGLNYILRFGGVFSLFALSSFGLYISINMGAEADKIAVSRLISSLCMFYIFCAVLLALSLRGLKFASGLGFVTAFSVSTYCHVVSPSYNHLPIEFLKGISIEMAILMAGLFLLTVFLDLLYMPDTHDA